MFKLTDLTFLATGNIHEDSWLVSKRFFEGIDALLSVIIDEPSILTQ